MRFSKTIIISHRKRCWRKREISIDFIADLCDRKRKRTIKMLSIVGSGEIGNCETLICIFPWLSYAWELHDGLKWINRRSFSCFKAAANCWCFTLHPTRRSRSRTTSHNNDQKLLLALFFAHLHVAEPSKKS